MKKIFILFTVICLIISCKTYNKKEQTIKVGVFNSKNDCPECITDVVECIKIDPMMSAELITALDIINGRIDNFDVIVIPGGSGRGMTINMGEAGMNKIRDWVMKQGKGIVGICAGAYALSNTPDYPCLGLSGGKAIDIEHDNRGHGLVKFTMTAFGKPFFPEFKNIDTLYCQYYEGPVIEDADDVDFNYIELAVMKSDVHTEEGSPALMTMDRPFIFANDVGKGRAVSFVGHPERTPGMRWMVPRMIRWACKAKIIKYNDFWVRPDIYKSEVLYTTEMKNFEQQAISKLSGNINDKISGMNMLVSSYSWAAKQFIPGLLRDTSSDVRVVAAKYIYELECTEALPDLETAIKMETKNQVKDLMKDYFNQLNKNLAK